MKSSFGAQDPHRSQSEHAAGGQHAGVSRVAEAARIRGLYPQSATRDLKKEFEPQMNVNQRG
jgi:hypothetical protein